MTKKLRIYEHYRRCLTLHSVIYCIRLVSPSYDDMLEAAVETFRSRRVAGCEDGVP